MGSKGRKKRRRSSSKSVAEVVLNNEERSRQEWWNETFLKQFAKEARLKTDFDSEFGSKVALLVASKAEPIGIRPEECAKLAAWLYDDFLDMRAAGRKEALAEWRGGEKPDPSAETKHWEEGPALQNVPPGV